MYTLVAITIENAKIVQTPVAQCTLKTAEMLAKFMGFTEWVPSENVMGGYFRNPETRDCLEVR